MTNTDMQMKHRQACGPLLQPSRAVSKSWNEDLCMMKNKSIDVECLNPNRPTFSFTHEFSNQLCSTTKMKSYLPTLNTTEQSKIRKRLGFLSLGNPERLPLENIKCSVQNLMHVKVNVLIYVVVLKSENKNHRRLAENEE